MARASATFWPCKSIFSDGVFRFRFLQQGKEHGGQIIWRADGRFGKPAVQNAACQPI